MPKLKIADRCRIDGRHVVVDGRLHSYRIHLGSAAVQREADSQHVCILPKVGGSRAYQRFLPFDDDPILAEILSKTFLLAEDDQIKDQVIWQQIRQRPS